MSAPTDAGRAQTRVSTTSGVHTVNLPSSIAAGDVLVGINVWDGGPGAITWPSGWLAMGLGRSQLVNAGQSVDTENLVGPEGGSLFNAFILWRVADGSEGSTIALDPTNSEASNTIIWRITGADPTVAPRFGVARGSSTSPDPPLFEPGWGPLDVLWIAAMGADSGTGSNSGTPTGYSNVIGGTGAPESGGVGVRGATKQGTADLDEDPDAYTLGAADQWVAVTIAVKGTGAIDDSAHDPFDIDTFAGRSDNGETDDLRAYLPTSRKAGDRAIILCIWDGGGGVPTVTTPSGWTLVGSQNAGSGSGQIGMKVYERELDGSEADTVDFATSPNEGFAWITKIVRGHDSAIPSEVAWATGTSTSPDPPNITPSWGTSDFLTVAFAGVNRGDHNLITGTPSGYERAIGMPSQAAYTGGVCIRASTKAVSAAASENPATYTGPNNEWVAGTLAVAARAVGPGSRFQAQWVA